MHKDSKGNFIVEHSVVVLNVSLSKTLWSVKGFDMTREYFVELTNGCVGCFAKASDLTAVDCVHEIVQEK